MPKVVVVTGASSGIGLATALAFAARGDRVVLSARSEDSLRRAERDCLAAGASGSLSTDNKVNATGSTTPSTSSR